MPLDRYARQMAVPGHGPEAQARLRAARVLVIGAGGLAAEVLPLLVGAGVGHVTLIDADTVALSNLHRQTLFFEADIGRSKVEAAAERMRGLNAEVGIEALETRFDPANAPTLVAGSELVLDCADSFAASYVASDACEAAGAPLLSASIVGNEGYAGGFCGGAPGLRAVFPDLPDRLGSCDADGVLGPSVGVVGALQAQMALRVLTGQDPSPLGLLVRYDARTLRTSQFRFDDATAPAQRATFVAPSTLTPDDFVVDLRAPEEPGPPLDGDLRATVSEFPDIPVPDDAARIVLVCRSGLRAWQAAARLPQDLPQPVVLIALGD